MREGQITLGVFTDDPMTAELPEILQRHCGLTFWDQSSSKTQLGMLLSERMPTAFLYKARLNRTGKYTVGPRVVPHGLLVSGDFLETVRKTDQFSDYLSGDNGAIEVKIGGSDFYVLPRNSLNGEMKNLKEVVEYLEKPASFNKKPPSCDY